MFETRGVITPRATPIAWWSTYIRCS